MHSCHVSLAPGLAERDVTLPRGVYATWRCKQLPASSDPLAALLLPGRQSAVRFWQLRMERVLKRQHATWHALCITVSSVQLTTRAAPLAGR
jgi:hypothetical protein